jgi:hypothetical protein
VEYFKVKLSIMVDHNPYVSNVHVFFLFHSIASMKTNDVKCKKKNISYSKEVY